MRLRQLAARSVSVATCAALLLLVAACGGGSDGGDDGTPVRPTQTLVAARTIVPGATPTPATASGETPSQADPQAAVDAVIQQVLLTQVEEKDIEVISATATEWPDSCLGIVYVGEDIVCEAVIVPGFEVVVHFGDTTMTWRTNEDGSVVRFATQEID